jgi:hypothetical protein
VLRSSPEVAFTFQPRSASRQYIDCRENLAEKGQKGAETPLFGGLYLEGNIDLNAAEILSTF